MGRPRKQKHCGLCGTTDPAAFSQNKHNPVDGLQGRCKECVRYAYFLSKLGLKPGPTAKLSEANSVEIRKAKKIARDAAERKNHPERVKRRRRQSRYRAAYNMSIEDVEAQINQQNGLCPIGNHLFGSTKYTSPHVDHDHRTGKYRAILCNRHNLALGQFQDSIPELQAAIDYLKLHIPDTPISHLSVESKEVD